MMLCFVLSMVIVSTWRDILSGFPVVLVNVYALGNEDSVL